MSKHDAAENYKKQAHEALKTGMFKWNKDFKMASYYFKKAAEEYRGAQFYQDSIACFMSACENYLAEEDYFNAAKCHENNAKIYKDHKNGIGKKKDYFSSQSKNYFTTEILQKYLNELVRAHHYYIQANSNDVCYHVMRRGASTLETEISQYCLTTNRPDLDKIREMTEACIKLINLSNDCIRDLPERGGDVSGNICLIGKCLLRQYNHTKNDNLINQMIKYYLERNHYHCQGCIEAGLAPEKLATFSTEICLLYLKNDDFVAAKRYWTSILNSQSNINPEVTGLKSIDEANVIVNALPNTQDFSILTQLLQFWEDDDGPNTKKLLKEHYYFKGLENEFVKLVKDLDNLPTGAGKPKIEEKGDGGPVINMADFIGDVDELDINMDNFNDSSVPKTVIEDVESDSSDLL